ncbi:MAG: hypothetical protein L0211_07355 [Planctomycetaceae bacterium]|nr:hypothetical protein [Planctomycetaceae bacterium]
MTTTSSPADVDWESEILSRVIDPDSPTFSVDASRAIIALGFDKADLARMNSLAESGRQGQLSPEENAELEAYLLVGRFLALIQAKARVSLRVQKTASRT